VVRVVLPGCTGRLCTEGCTPTWVYREAHTGIYHPAYTPGYTGRPGAREATLRLITTYKGRQEAERPLRTLKRGEGGREASQDLKIRGETAERPLRIL